MSDTGLIEAASGQCKTMADGTLRITFDVEPRHAAAAFALFSAPGTPAVLGRLVAAHEKAPAVPAQREEQKPPMGPLCKWAVLRCGESSFQEWIRPVYDRVMGGDGRGWGDVTPEHDFGGSVEKYASHCVKVIAEVQSRRELDTNQAAGDYFKSAVMAPYGKWLASRGAA